MLPAAHAMHVFEVAPTVDDAVPEAHWSQAFCPVAFWYLPAEHEVQELATAAAPNCPSGHAVQEPAAAAEN